MIRVLSNSRTAEINQVMKDIEAASRKKDWSGEIHITGIFNDLAPISERMSIAVNRDISESRKAELDESRDDTYRSIVQVVEGYLANPIPAIKSAAVKVQAVIDKYGLSILRESYTVETSELNSFLRDMAELEAEIGELPGLANLIAKLTEEQAAFEEANRAFVSDKAVEGVQESATKIKTEAVELINGTLYFYLNAMNRVAEETYGELAREVAEIIERNNSAVRKRTAQ